MGRDRTMLDDGGREVFIEKIRLDRSESLQSNHEQ